MRVTVFTSNQRRHASLIGGLAGIAESVFAVQEVTTLFPGAVDDFYRKSPVMQTYFARVMAAEEKVFGPPTFTARNVRTIAVKMGDLSSLSCDWLKECLEADAFIVFGASFIRPPLVDLLVERRALNIHVGVSPYYRGNSCNFWAAYDNNAEYVGATIHLLTQGLDSGPILCHAFPRFDGESVFEYTMKAVKAAHQGLIARVADGTLNHIEPVPQDKALQLRYSKNSDFRDEVAAEFLSRQVTPDDLASQVGRRKLDQFVNPVVSG